MGTTVKRPVQTEMPEVRNALEHLKSPAVQQAREKHLDAVSQAQGGRWLDSDTVAHEGAGGYGTMHHHLQTASPEVQAALVARASPEWQEEDEKRRRARADAQGGRWMDSDNMPRSLPSQLDQPDVQQALAAAHDPEKKRELERKQAARAATQGGRWLE